LALLVARDLAHLRRVTTASTATTATSASRAARLLAGYEWLRVGRVVALLGLLRLRIFHGRSS
jgi:hypothetical protein